MIPAIAGLIEEGRVKVYCVDSWDSVTWQDDWLPLEERARRHGAFEDWLLSHVVPWIHADCSGYQEIGVTGVSMGAFHAANLTLRRADVFPLALCLSGLYDISRVGWGERGDTFYFNNPLDYVSHLARRAPRLALLPGSPRPRRRPRRRGRTRPARSTRPTGSHRCSRGRGFHTSWTSGERTRRTTGPHGNGRSLTIYPALSEHPHRSPARHRGRLAPGLRGARLPAAGGTPRRRDAHLPHRADHQRAVRPPRAAALRAGDRPPRLVVRDRARVGEEGGADGRRLPAEQPVHVPGDGKALRLLRDDPPRAEGPGDLDGPAQGADDRAAARVHGRRSSSTWPRATTSPSSSATSRSRSATRCT